ncbi:Lrp/AsnC family transcriptional regulator [Priestia koreensis]|uniref:Lrp/AsnC family transcriptional regulator n=1 Tax=Priestia koreensis TaxID=284581 RepID=UPI0034576BC8
MDSFDSKIIHLLTNDARMRWADLASQIGLSAPATADRVNRLIDQGVIKGFRASIEPETVGCECTAFVAVSLERPQHRTAFLELVNNKKEIQECHHIAGEDDYLLKIRCRNTKDLDRVISHEIKGVEGVTRTKTTIVMDTTKESSELALQPHVFSEE